MKKRLLVLVTLLTMILIPWNVEAEEGVKIIMNEEPYKCETRTEGTKKITECQIVAENTMKAAFNGGTILLTLIPNHTSTAITFEVDTTYAHQNGNPTQGDNNSKVYELNVDPISSGGKAILGTVKFTANASLTDIDCGGGYKVAFKEAIDDGDDSDDEEITDTGYAVPTVALAIGAVGVITVVATSKKKTKMYKI